ncbi:hypothetical protein TWF730_006790 [Orbilia blumenaviensis]|uniref:RNA polymerase III RPC4 n=1 Tax=Orbilia blumenaviensis TaxID=1796055 RepID=A0AAV9VLJ8_9PEZI
MPPKPRGRPAKPRGGAAAAAASSAESSHQQTQEPADLPPSSSSTAAATTTDPSLTLIPSESIESTPLAIPPPSGRLEGLNNPSAPNLRSTRGAAAASSSSSTAAAIAAGGEASGSSTVAPPILAPGERPKPKLKFAPKNTTRKTKEEREQLNRKYAPPPDESVNAFGVTRGGPSGRGARGRGRGRGGLGRGGEGLKREEAAVASGPFSMGSVITMGGKQKISIERTSRSFRTNRMGGSKIKREVGEDGQVKDELYSSSDSEGGPKVDVEMIELISSDDEDDGEGGEKKYSSVKGFAPVRIERREHVDKLAQQSGGGGGGGVKEEKGKRDAKGKGKEVDLEILEERKARPGRRDSGTGPRVKIEPSESPKATRRSTRSPEVKKKQSSSPEDRRRKQMARSRSGNRKKDIIVPQSQEDFEEIERYEQDRFSMLRELGPALPERGVDAEGDHDMGDDSAPPVPPPDEKQNKLYLFQFPPVLPLMEPAEEVDDAETQVKEEDSAAPAAAAASSSHQPAIKKEEIPRSKYTTLEEVQKAQLPPGTAGKLNVHRSGKVTMVFGGIEFEVHRGIDCEFLQDIVVLQKDSGAVDERGRPKGRAWGMGQLKGKFVATPDISKLV